MGAIPGIPRLQKRRNVVVRAPVSKRDPARQVTVRRYRVAVAPLTLLSSAILAVSKITGTHHSVIDTGSRVLISEESVRPSPFFLQDFSVLPERSWAWYETIAKVLDDEIPTTW
jgi:hypothetical protein